MELNKIYNMDCLEGMKNIDDDFIDLTVTSPPYDDMRSYQGYNFDFEITIKELYRITKKGGVVVWVVGDKTSEGSETGTSFKQALFFMKVGFNLHDTMIYEKKNPTPTPGNRYQQSFEYMFVFSKGKPKVFNPIKTKKKYMENRKNKYYNKDKEGNQVSHGYQTKTDTRIVKNIWSYSVGLNNTTQDKEAFKHPAVFPEKLAEDHILSWSNESDIVFDPFAGSGTTLKMAMMNNRKFLGFDLSDVYVDIAKKRLTKHTKSNYCFCGKELIWQSDFEDFSYYSCSDCDNDVFISLQKSLENERLQSDIFDFI